MSRLPKNQLKNVIYEYIESNSSIEHPDNFLLLTKEKIIEFIKNKKKYENSEKEIAGALKELEKEKSVKLHDIEKRIFIAKTEKGKELVKYLREMGLSPPISSVVILAISIVLAFYVLNLSMYKNGDFMNGALSLLAVSAIIVSIIRIVRDTISYLIKKLKKEEFLKRNKKYILLILIIAIVALIILAFAYVEYATPISLITALLITIFASLMATVIKG